MSNSGYPYRETLLQWIWKELEFDTTSLRTSAGDLVEIIKPGKINNGAGPDFKDAEIRINSLKFFGDVEIHIKNRNWAEHNHEESDDFNSVILHVVFDGDIQNSQPAHRPDGTTPPLLILEPYLQKSLAHLFDRRQNTGLPCSGQISFINQNAFEYQIEKAHRDYFEYKTDFLLNYYDGSQPLTKAWLGLLSKGLFNTIGIPRNREQMEQFYERLQTLNIDSSITRFISNANKIAFHDIPEDTTPWVESGMRPASVPSKRVPQAAALYHAIHSIPFKTFLSASDDLWQVVLAQIPKSFQPGKQMSSILEFTILYPSVYLLGEFLHAKKVKAHAYSCWLNASGGVPGAVIRPFKTSGFNIKGRALKPGLAHQLKRYCRPLNCHRCEVFKKAINP
jgi:hypothetical protein